MGKIDNRQILSSAVNEDENMKRRKDCLDDNIICAYAAKTLSTKEKKKAETHLASCGYCRREAVELFRIIEAVEKEKLSEPSEESVQKVKDRIHSTLSIKNIRAGRFQLEEI